jgi:hypothetical protein
MSRTEPLNAYDAEILCARIAALVGGGRFEFSKHAVDQTILREITTEEIRQVLADSEVLENYPSDKYGPSCLVLGFTQAGRPLHIHCTHPTREPMKIITVYEPDPLRWVDFRQRRG